MSQNTFNGAQFSQCIAYNATFITEEAAELDLTTLNLIPPFRVVP